MEKPILLLGSNQIEHSHRPIHRHTKFSKYYVHRQSGQRLQRLQLHHRLLPQGEPLHLQGAEEASKVIILSFYMQKMTFYHASCSARRELFL
jgi:hypothetical protein